MSSQCKGCRARIVWIKMVQKADGSPGGVMPCDPDWTFGDGESTLIVLDPDTGYGSMIPKADRSVLGRVPHWATCPERERFKAKKQQTTLFE